MVVADREALVEALREEVGDALRALATYDREGYEAVYVRGGLGPRMARQGEAIHDELVLQGIGRDHLEDLFGAGGLQCSMHRFEDLTAFHFPAAAYTGLFVSVDSTEDVALATVAETCKRYMDAGDGQSV